ncbi:MAG: hypothetical protein U5K72_09830 [Balneolaceae bacterium]|nr:hypothetical protein [Balneolaceae bacterium]
MKHSITQFTGTQRLKYHSHFTDYMKKTFYPILLILTFLNYSPVSAQFANPNGDLKPVDDDEIWAKTLEGSHYNEMWNYHFYLNDGLIVHLAFSVANFGSFKSPVSGLQMSIYNLDGELYQVSREYPINELIQDREKQLFKLHENRTILFRGKLPKEHQVHVEFTKHDVFYKVKLDFSNIHRGLKWGDGTYHIQGDDVGIITHIPYAEVRGTVAVNDVEKSVKGTAYMDHTYQDRATTDLVQSGYRFVHQQNSQNWDTLYYLLPKNNARNYTVGLRIKKENGKLSVNGTKRISRMNSSEVFDVSIARIMDLEMEKEPDIRLTRTYDYEKFSILGELGWFARRAARSFLGGEVISVRGRATLMETGNRPENGFYNFYTIE